MPCLREHLLQGLRKPTKVEGVWSLLFRPLSHEEVVTAQQTAGQRWWYIRERALGFPSPLRLTQLVQRGCGRCRWLMPQGGAWSPTRSGCRCSSFPWGLVSLKAKPLESELSVPRGNVGLVFILQTERSNP